MKAGTGSKRRKTVAPVPAWSWRSAGFALVATAGIYVLLPLMERISQPPSDVVETRELRTVEVPPPRQPPPPRRPRTESSVTRKDLPQPELRETRPKMEPQRLRVELEIGPGDVRGDFQTEFAVTGEAMAAGLENPVFEIAELDTPPRALSRMRPLYPPRARVRKVEGYVVVEFVVGVDGTVTEVHIVESRPPGVFETSVRRTVAAWRFEPGRKGGRAVPARVSQRIDFNLQ